mmetsp:Transcript_53232/g.124114  ORF Transcript_53232/g.124114 Transcript_53232/m.124114 type:complete len:255 (-) Transcript_53232:1220-1984(-)
MQDAHKGEGREARQEGHTKLLGLAILKASGTLVEDLVLLHQVLVTAPVVHGPRCLNQLPGALPLPAGAAAHRAGAPRGPALPRAKHFRSARVRARANFFDFRRRAFSSPLGGVDQNGSESLPFAITLPAFTPLFPMSKDTVYRLHALVAMLPAALPHIHQGAFTWSATMEGMLRNVPLAPLLSAVAACTAILPRAPWAQHTIFWRPFQTSRRRCFALRRVTGRHLRQRPLAVETTALAIDGDVPVAQHEAAASA